MKYCTNQHLLLIQEIDMTPISGFSNPVKTNDFLERDMRISFAVKESILLSLKATQDEFIQDVLFFTALMLYKKRKLSLGKAAELAGYGKLLFIEKLQQEGEVIFDYNQEELAEIFADVAKLP
jgi:predicted HTH domain antitoxin